MPDERREGAALDLVALELRPHRNLFVGKADPHGGCALAGVAHEGCIGVVLGRARLAGIGVVGQVGPPPGAAHDGRERPGQLVVDRLVEHGGWLRRTLEQLGALGVEDAGDHHGVDPNAIAGEGRIDGGHLDHIDVLGAQNRGAHGLDATFTDTEVLGHLNEAGRADVDHQLGINRVLRPLGRIGQGAVAFGAAADFPGGAAHRRVGDFDRGSGVIEAGDRDAELESDGQTDRLHRRASLSARSRSKVELGVVVGAEEVAAADHGKDVAVVGRSDAHDDRSSVGVERSVGGGLGQDPLDRSLGLGLQIQIDGGVDVEPTLEQQGDALFAGRAEPRVVEEPLLDVLDKVRRRILLFEDRNVLDQIDRLEECRLVFLFGDVIVGVHAQQHEVTAVSSGLVVDVRVEPSGSLDQAGNGCCLDDRQFGDLETLAVIGLGGACLAFAGWRTEVGAGGCLNAVGTVPEVHPVEVLLKDEFLGVALLKAPSHEDLFDLA